MLDRGVCGWSLDTGGGYWVGRWAYSRAEEILTGGCRGGATGVR